MKIINNCPICGSPSLECLDATLATFIAVRIGAVKMKTSFCYCAKCDFAFFDTRYTLNIRDSNLDLVTQQMANVFDMKSVLDYGGDSGQFIPKYFFYAKKYVYEIRKVKLPKGIAYIDIRNTKKKFDFIMCCHVLEHVSEPEKIISDLKRCAQKRSWIYLEVPYNSFDRGLVSKKKRIQHEHINFFTLKSMTKFLQKQGLDIVFIFARRHACNGYMTLSCLCKLK